MLLSVYSPKKISQKKNTFYLTGIDIFINISENQKIPYEIAYQGGE